MRTKLLGKVRRKVRLYMPSKNMYVVTSFGQVRIFEWNPLRDYKRTAFNAYRDEVRDAAALIAGSRAIKKNRAKKMFKNRIR